MLEYLWSCLLALFRYVIGRPEPADTVLQCVFGGMIVFLAIALLWVLIAFFTRKITVREPGEEGTQKKK